jgi:hypothetical protein
MRFDDETQLAQEFLDLLGAFDLDGSGWMAQLNLHGGIIGWAIGMRQGAEGKQRANKAKIFRL